MISPDNIGTVLTLLHLDEHFNSYNIFSTRVTNALLRRGIITPRILIMHTREMLIQNTRNLGTKGINEIDDLLKQHSWKFPQIVDERHVELLCRLSTVFYKITHSLSLSTLTMLVNEHCYTEYNESEILVAVSHHPYIEKLEIETGAPLFRFNIQKADFACYEVDGESQLNSQSESLTAPIDKQQLDTEIAVSELESIEQSFQNSLEGETSRINLANIWSIWLSKLDERQQKILFLCYGLEGDESHTLQEVGEALGLTRERVRQIKNNAIWLLRKAVEFANWQPVDQLLIGAVQQSNHLLTPKLWDEYLDEHTTWDHEQPRPNLLQLFCASSDRFHFVERYQIATYTEISIEHLDGLQHILKSKLRKAGKGGLALDELVAIVLLKLPPNFPNVMRERDFIVMSLSIFDKIGFGTNGHCINLRKSSRKLYPNLNPGWIGKPGSQLREWEVRIRQQFEKIAWIGQVRLSDNDFRSMCQAIQEEAFAPNYFSKLIEGQPLLVPPAVFLTTMVLSARYTQLSANDSVDEFWAPYLGTVWNTEYSQAFYVRCKKRFNSVTAYLETEYGFEFPHISKGNADVVTAVFRHALIPQYMQDDFARWIHKNWQGVLSASETSIALSQYLRNDHSLDQYSHRLRHFFTSDATSKTAATLVSSLAIAIGMHLLEGELVDSISNLLTDTPIELELWHEIVKEFYQHSNPIIKGQSVAGTSARGNQIRSDHNFFVDSFDLQDKLYANSETTKQTKSDSSASLRVSKPRVNWMWALDKAKLLLRAQNIMLPSDGKFEGEPDRLVWLPSADADPLAAEIEVEVSPWKMKTGERIIQEAIFPEIDNFPGGILALLTDMDEATLYLEVPPLPSANIQFFRTIQQNAYGIPVDINQVDDGVWFVCAKNPLMLFDEDHELIESDAYASVPFPLDEEYYWAAVYSLTLPITIEQGTEKLYTLTRQSSQSAFATPELRGDKPLAGLSHQVSPVFSDTQVGLKVEYGGMCLLKQASLWVQGKSGQRWQRTFSDLYQDGHLLLIGDSLHIDFIQLLPSVPDIYAVDIRINLKSILSSPIQFCIIPGLTIDFPTNDQLYTPANPFALTLHGVTESQIVQRDSISISDGQNGTYRVVWHDLRNEPYLLLRFDMVDIPLSWSILRFIIWLEPAPSNPFLTLEELRKTSIHAISTDDRVNTFSLVTSTDNDRLLSLKRGRYDAQISQTQLYDMVRLNETPNINITVKVGAQTWCLVEVRQRPQLSLASVEYIAEEHIIRFQSGLDHEWIGNGRFLVESLTNPFTPLFELTKFSTLSSDHLIPVTLNSGHYLFRIELDGTWLDLNENQSRFTVGQESDELDRALQLVHEIRNGQIISPGLAEEFVLWWAEIAESQKNELTDVTLFQLATVPSNALKHFTIGHLENLWHTLAAIKAVNDLSSWIDTHGLPPAWIFLTNSIILKTADRGYPLSVYPIRSLPGGLWGSGYGCWHLTMTDGGPREFVFVQWRPSSDAQVIVEAGIPESLPHDWSTIELIDTFSLYHCSRCGRLTGVKDSYTLPEELMQIHLHGHDTHDLRDITQPEGYGGYQLLADFYLDRRGPPLTDIYEQYGVIYPSTSAYLPEPMLPSHLLFDSIWAKSKLAMLSREIIRIGAVGAELSPWVYANRLLNHWSIEKSVSQFGQLIFAFGMLLRSAAYQPRQFQRLCKETRISIADIQSILAEINQSAHLAWGVTWAELLFLSKRSTVSEGSDYESNQNL